MKLHEDKMLSGFFLTVYMRGVDTGQMYWKKITMFF